MGISDTFFLPFGDILLVPMRKIKNLFIYQVSLLKINEPKGLLFVLRLRLGLFIILLERHRDGKMCVLGDRDKENM